MEAAKSSNFGDSGIMQKNQTFLRLLRDERGLSAIEYGILAGLVALAAVQALGGLGSEVSSKMDGTSNTLATQNANMAGLNRNNNSSNSTPSNPYEPAYSEVAPAQQELPPIDGGAHEPAPAMAAPPEF